MVLKAWNGVLSSYGSQLDSTCTAACLTVRVHSVPMLHLVAETLCSKPTHLTALHILGDIVQAPAQVQQLVRVAAVAQRHVPCG
jgi:hypothetical protein